jgi:hypothetical protein
MIEINVLLMRILVRLFLAFLWFCMSVCIRGANVTVINVIEMCAMLVDLFWAVVHLGIASLQADYVFRCGVFLKMCLKLLVVLLLS